MSKNIIKSFQSYKQYFFIAISFLLLILFGRILIENKDLVYESFLAIKNADKSWILLGGIIYSITVIFSSLILILLSFVKLPLWLTVKEQASLLFVNKVLPSGLGQLTLNSYYLHKEGNTSSQTASIITIKAFVTGIGLSILLIYFFYINLGIVYSVMNILNLYTFFDAKVIFSIIILGFIFSSAIYLLLTQKKIKNKIANPIYNFKSDLLEYKEKPEKILFSLLFAFLINIFMILTLIFISQSVGLNILFREAMFIYFLGLMIAGIIPVPGGIGTTEIGLYIGFYILGYDPAIYLSAILIYRFINYWIPLVIGYMFFLNLRKNILKNFTFNSS